MKLLNWLDKYAFFVSAHWFFLAVVIYAYHNYEYYVLVATTIMCVAGWVAVSIKGLIWVVEMLRKTNA